MARLDERIRRLEDRAPKVSPGEKREKALSEAIEIIHDALEAALPGDETLKRVRISDCEVRLVHISGSKSHHEKLLEMRKRIMSESATEEDDFILASLPESALDVLGLSAADYVTTICGVLEKY